MLWSVLVGVLGCLGGFLFLSRGVLKASSSCCSYVVVSVMFLVSFCCINFDLGFRMTTILTLCFLLYFPSRFLFIPFPSLFSSLPPFISRSIILSAIAFQGSLLSFLLCGISFLIFFLFRLSISSSAFLFLFFSLGGSLILRFTFTGLLFLLL